MTYLGWDPREIDWGRRVLARPEAGSEDPDREVHSSELSSVGKVGLELVIDGVGERHVLEHPLQLRSELTPALRLQFANHHLFRIVRGRLLVQ